MHLNSKSKAASLRNIRWLSMIAICGCLATALHAQWYADYLNGLQALKERDWQGALQNLNAAVVAKPNPTARARTDELYYLDYLPFLYRSIAYYRLQEFRKAERDLLYSKAFGEIEKARIDKNARALFRRYLMLINKHKELEGMVERGRDLSRLGNYAAAKEQLEHVLRIDPDHLEAEKLLQTVKREVLIAKLIEEAREQLRADNYSEALRILLKLRQVAPENPEINSMISYAETTIDRQSTKTAKPGIHDNRGQVTQLAAEGVRLYNQGKLDDAEVQFNQILELVKYDATAVRYLSLIRKRRTAEAKRGSKNESARLYSMAVQEFEDGKIDQAKRLFSQILERFPKHSESKQQLQRINRIEAEITAAREAFEAHDFEQALDLLRHLSQKYPKVAEVYILLGCVYSTQYYLSGADNQHLLDEATANFRRAKAITPECQPDESLISPKIVALFHQA